MMSLYRVAGAIALAGLIGYGTGRVYRDTARVEEDRSDKNVVDRFAASHPRVFDSGMGLSFAGAVGLPALLAIATRSGERERGQKPSKVD